MFMCICMCAPVCVCSCSLFWVATQNPRHACPVMQNYYRRTSNMPEDLRCLAWRRLADSLFTASNLDRTASKRLASALAMHTSLNPIQYLFKSCVSLQSQLNMRYHCICESQTGHALRMKSRAPNGKYYLSVWRGIFVLQLQL